MASADKSPVVAKPSSSGKAADSTAIDFLPDADEIERRPLPRVARHILHLLLLALVSFFCWASLSKVDEIVVARGRLVTPLPNIVVQPLETSVIQSIEVRMGQVVGKGDRLATLDPTVSQADESQLKSRLASLDTQLAGIEAALAGNLPPTAPVATSDSGIQSRLSRERQASYMAQMQRQTELVERLRSSLRTAQRDESAMASRVAVLREMDTMTDDLVNKKLAVKSRLLDARDRLLEAERNLELARNRQLELRRELASAEAEKTSFQTGWRQRLLEESLAASRERDSVVDQLQKASRRQSMVVLTAPADAVVLEVAKLSQGSIVREAEAFFTLVPIGGELEVEIQIDAQDIGQVKIGETTLIKLDAFPFQKHGTLTGVLRTISQDAFRRDQGAAAGGPDAYYSARVVISNQHLDNMPEHVKLLPGMTASAEILVGKRSIISYLLWPLTKAFSEAIREP
jgi:HlyD family secretion protein